MITASFLWLILSHIAVFIPIIVAYKINKRRWLACSIVLLLTAFFSSIYHWHEKPESEELIIFGTGFSVHKSIDFFCSYLSIFLVVFYCINPRRKPEHIDISLMIIVIICHILTLVHILWYYFCLIVTLFCFIYKILSKKTNWMLTIKNIYKNFWLFILATASFVAAMIMQYHYCIINPSGFYYHIYHGFWHFFMFLSAAIWMIWNDRINHIEKRTNPQVELVDDIENNLNN